ncbi:hypothetical protein ACPX19_05095 [Winogradskyella sp. HB-48]|uniref:hypothetical protein n=1 Tax=Winogradskyella sp. HB-48 TaxID=3416808 RepID=UPI003CF4FEB2
MGEVILKQTVHPNVKWILGYPFLLAFLILSFVEPDKIYLLVLPVLVLSYGFDYVFTDENKSYVRLNLFKIVVFKFEKTFIKPTYISLFKQAFSREVAFGFSPQILGDQKYSLYTIKLFNDNENMIVFESEDKARTLKLGRELSELLQVELYNTLE